MIVMGICHFDETNSFGGLEKQALLLARTLKARGEDIVMLASTRRWRSAGWTERDGVPVRLFWTYDTPQVSGKKLPASLLWAVQILVWMFLNRRRIQLFHAHQIRIHAFVGAIARKFWGIPHILKSATGGSGADIRAIGTHKYFYAPGRRFIIRHTDVFIATTETIRDDLLEYGVPAERIVMIPNGLVLPDLSSFTPVADAERVHNFVFLGRIGADKNVIALAQAASQTFTATGSAALDIWGKGPQEEELAALTRETTGRVTYRGYTDKPWNVMGNYGFLVLPSLAEGLSNAMLEAMCFGLVPITTRVSGCVDHIREGETGFFIDGAEPADISRALARAAQLDVSVWQSISQTVQKYARGMFDINVVAQKYIDLYKTFKA